MITRRSAIATSVAGIASLAIPSLAFAENPILYVFEVDDGEQHWYAAHDKNEALQMYLEPLLGKTDYERMLNGCPTYSIDEVLQRDVGVKLEELDINQCNDETMVSIYDEADDHSEIKSFRQWADDNGAGFLASTCW